MAGEVAPALAKQQAPEVLEYCTTIVAMMTWDHLDSGLCQHVITLINRALDSPDGPHKGFSKCLALRQRLVAALLDRGLMRVITDLQDLVQESLFQVRQACMLSCPPPTPIPCACLLPSPPAHTPASLALLA